MNRPKIYIAGPVTGRTDYEEKFNEAAELLEAFGCEALNPIAEGLVYGWEYRDYINRGLRLLMEADAVYMLPDWEKSPGARFERMYAEICGIRVYEGKV